MKKLLPLLLIFASCEKEPICIRFEKQSTVYEFCDGDVDASVTAYNLTNQGFLCERY